MRRRLFQISLLTAVGALVVLYWPVSESPLIPVENAEGKMGLINGEGRFVLEPVWDWVIPPDEAGYIAALTINEEDRKKSRWNWMDVRGNRLFPFEFDAWLPDGLDDMSEGEFDPFGLLPVCKDSRCGWIDREGKIAVPLEWDAISPFDSEGMAQVVKRGKVGWIDTGGEIVIPLRWDAARPFNNFGLSPVCLDSKWGVIRRDGSTLVEPKWGWAKSDQPDHFGMIHVSDSESGKRGCFDLSGRLVIPALWNDIGDFDAKGFAVVTGKPSRKFGWINTRGELVIPLQFDGAGSSFDVNDVANVSIDGKWLLIGRTGEPIDDQNYVTPGVKEDFDSNGLRTVDRGWGIKGWENSEGEMVIALDDRNWNGHLAGTTSEHYVVSTRAEPTWVAEKFQEIKDWFGKGPTPKPGEKFIHCYFKNGTLIYSSDWVRFETKGKIVLGCALVLAFFVRPKRRRVGEKGGRRD